jgi:ABC-type phosphate/phosphonate transport system substrate-binding protein
MFNSPRSYQECVFGLGAAALIAAGGCAQSKEPVRFATTRGACEPMVLQGTILEIFETAPFRVVRNGVSKSVGRPTQFMCLKPDQIHTHLASGHVQFAFIDQGDEAEVLADDAGVIIATPQFKESAPQDVGLFVVAADSDIEDLSQLRGKRVAFGPPNHPVLHWAALDAIKQAGVEEDDLAKQMLPIPGSLQYHLSSIDSAKAALFKIEADVAVVDEEEYMKWPETGGNVVAGALSISIARDQLKVIGRTEPVMLFPSGPVVASREADPDLVEKVRDYLLDDVAKERRITNPLKLIHYVAVEQ